MFQKVSRLKSLVRPFYRYSLISVLSFTTNLGLTALLTEVISISEEIAFAISIAVVLITNFLFVRYYIFPGTQLSLAKQLAVFTTSSISFRGLEYIIFLLLHTWLGMQYLLAIASILSTSFLTKFLFFKFIFNRKL